METGLLLQRIKVLLQQAYGDRLRGVVLYGSEARRQAEPDSDLDILVLLEGPVEFGRELRKIIDTLYDLQLEILRPLHAMPVTASDFEAGKYSVYRNAKAEGIFA